MGDIQKPKVGSVQTVAQYLEGRKEQLRAVMPATMKPERLIKVAISAASRNPMLLQCDPASLYAALHGAAQLGLEAGSPLGGAYLVPFSNKKKGKTECQLIVGYRGLIDLARRSGQIQSIEAHVVRKGDEFELLYGTDSKLTHRPNLDSKEPGEMIFAYAVAKLTGGGVQMEVMTRAEINAIRRRSKSQDSGPWVTDFEEMARKTVVRRLCKYLPLTIEMATALERDEATLREAGDGTVDVAPDLDLDVPQAPLTMPEDAEFTESEPSGKAGEILAEVEKA